jgi:uncharacterized protein DUF6431
MPLPGCPRAGQDLAVPVEREGSLLASFCADRGEGSEAVSRPVAIVWPCPLAVDAYVAAGRDVEFPRPDCPSCAGPLVFWSGYRRHVRAAGRCQKIFVPRLRCAPCRVSHALLPAFVLAWRLDVAETVGTVIAEVTGGRCGVRPAAARAGVPHTTAGGWVRRFAGRGGELGVAFAALAVELGGQAIRPAAEAGRFALAAIGAAFGAAAGLPARPRPPAAAPVPGRSGRLDPSDRHHLKALTFTTTSCHAHPA